MSADFTEALQLLFTGMITVFVVLFLVVGVGNAIVRIVNRYMPEEVKAVKARVAVASSAGSFDANKVAAISAAVTIVTSGKGKVTNIERI